MSSLRQHDTDNSRVGYIHEPDIYLCIHLFEESQTSITTGITYAYINTHYIPRWPWQETRLESCSICASLTLKMHASAQPQHDASCQHACLHVIIIYKCYFFFDLASTTARFNTILFCYSFFMNSNHARTSTLFILYVYFILMLRFYWPLYLCAREYIQAHLNKTHFTSSVVLNTLSFFLENKLMLDFFFGFEWKRLLQQVKGCVNVALRGIHRVGHLSVTHYKNA